MTSETTANYVNDSEFNQLLTEQKLVVADYTASWCGPCKVVAPLVDKLATEYGDRVTVVKIDIDENKDNTKKYGIRSIPAVLIFRDGEMVESLFGSKPYETYRDSIETQLQP
jgi:thioredoxin 1